VKRVFARFVLQILARCVRSAKRVGKQAKEICMGNRFQAWRNQRLSAWTVWLLSAGMLISLQRVATAHDLLAAYIQHGMSLTVGARYSDLEIDLTFFEEWSARERAIMDADGNGRITRSELGAYSKKLESELEGQVKMRVAGQDLTLTLLYAPEVDLLGNDRVGPAHHRLRVLFFAPTSAQMRAGDEIVIEDLLWPAAKALGALQANGRDRCTLTIVKKNGAAFASASPGGARLFKARCVELPKATAETPAVTPAHTRRRALRSQTE
jgi:hypothetical protein